MRVSVIVPTFRRPDDLERCLRALDAQSRLPDEVLLVARRDDELTKRVLDRLPEQRHRLVPVLVDRSGQVHALNAALAIATGDILAFTDDDAAPRPDWLARIEEHFAADRRIGAVGGRDFVHQHGTVITENRLIVGKIRWFGRIIWNYHLGCGPARDVDCLKGVNMSYRREAIGDLSFDRRLRGGGAEVHNDMAFCLAVKRRGWRVVYDPAVAVDHYMGIRHDADQRDRFNATAQTEITHNETLIILDHVSAWQRPVYAVWSLAVGQAHGFGLLQWVRFRLKGDRLAGARLGAALRGRLEGWRTWRSGRKPPTR